MSELWTTPEHIAVIVSGRWSSTGSEHRKSRAGGCASPESRRVRSAECIPVFSVGFPKSTSAPCSSRKLLMYWWRDGIEPPTRGSSGRRTPPDQTTPTGANRAYSATYAAFCQTQKTVGACW